MSKQRPPIDRTGGGGAPSNDVGTAPTVNPAPDTEKEFEFSRLVLGEEIPFALPPQRIERGWARLSKASTAAREVASGGDGRRRLTGLLVAFAACAATFAAGVWVGEGNGGRGGFGASARVMSAEPVNATLPSGNPLADVQRSEPSLRSVGPAAATTSVAPELQGPGVNEADRSRLVGAARLGHGVRASINVSPGATGASGGLPAPVHTAEAAAAATANAVGAPAWQRLAYDGDYEGALVEITGAGGFERVLQLASAEQLMLLSDVARGTGQQQRALAALRRIVSEHAADPVAPLAALNMGNLLDKMGDGVGATRAFAVYRALSPKGDFAEDALVRQIRSALGAGQQDLARRLVRQYEVDFPEGRQADEVARWAEQIPTESEASDAGAASE